MSKPIANNLEEVHSCLLECAFSKRSFEDIRSHISDELMLYGTAAHEKIFGVAGLKNLFDRQIAEMEQFTFKWNIEERVLDLSLSDDIRLLVEELKATIEEIDHTLTIRMSSVWKLLNDSWMLLHLHGSVPDPNIQESESFPYEGILVKNKELEEMIAKRTQELKESLENLKATQNQLIHSEKMASLGELTAGIAHEIQNPLNFVNNFAEVNRELLNEMEEAIQKGNYVEAKEISKSIAENQQKINHHGKRAEEIVKGMLQHSRGSSGEKELTDINNLCDEYLRLAYHGLRAKDKSFNSKFETDFDLSIPKLNVVPQDIGRVVLNLINNAFQAVSESGKEDPSVWVSTRKLNHKIEISVKDNGIGIPDAIKDKIFQPFFTTKPTGSGTGLGLSISYDIVKAHGGEIVVESKENEGTEFRIML